MNSAMTRDRAERRDAEAEVVMALIAAAAARPASEGRTRNM
jgi:hypothetical protein